MVIVRKLLKLVVVFAVMLLVYVFYAYGVTFLCKQMIGSMENESELREEINRVKDEARKLDPEDQKRIVITEDLLKVEYRNYYRSKQDSNNFLVAIVIWVLGTLFVASIAAFLITLILGKFKIKKSISCLIPAILIAVGVFVLQRYLTSKLPPKPADVKCALNSVEVERKNSKTKTYSNDDDNTTSTSTSYYIYFTDKNGKEQEFRVSEDEYDAIKVKDTCYVASAEAGEEIVFYKMYTIGRYYMLPADAGEN